MLILSNLNLRNSEKRRKGSGKLLVQSEQVRTPWRQKIGGFFKHTKQSYAVIAAVVALCYAFLGFPKSIVDFKSNVGEARQYMFTHLYQTEKWTGVFDTYPEGVADMNDLAISSDVEAALDLAIFDDHSLDGTIWWDRSCEIGIYTGLLLEGNIRIGGRAADVVVWELVGGERFDIFSGVLRNDGTIIQFSKFPATSGLNDTRIARNPPPATLEKWGELHCDWFIEKITKNHVDG